MYARKRRKPITTVALVTVAALCMLIAAGCGNKAKSGNQTIGVAKTFTLSSFSTSVPPKINTPTQVNFQIQMPNGKPLTKYKTGLGPHTGIHFIVVPTDLHTIIHLHPPISKTGWVHQSVTFPSGGPWHLLVDAYPDPSVSSIPNFQLTHTINVQGKETHIPLGGYNPDVVVNGYHFSLGPEPTIHVAQPTFLPVKITDPHGNKVDLKPWYGALAHAVFFHEGDMSYFHVHVCGAKIPECAGVAGAPSSVNAKTGGIRFGILLPEPGHWRLFLQTKVQGHILTVPEMLVVKP